MPRLLIIGHTFPEITTTAAGVRMRQLIDFFSGQGYQITFASTARESINSAKFNDLNITVRSIVLNCRSFNRFVADFDPHVVLFDRFMTEEQFGWRVASTCPNAIRILDTEDLHFLRRARELAIKAGDSIEKADLYSELAIREIASIFRSDLSLIISRIEFDILIQKFGLSEELLYYLPLFPKREPDTIRGYNERQDFMCIGNFRHRPNLDAIHWLSSSIWPGMQEELPEAKLNIYGAYPPEAVMNMHDPERGFFVHGWAPDLAEVMSTTRVLLAPLRFGAGLKGKVIEALNYGTVVVGTPVAAEGIGFEGHFPTTPCQTVEQMIELSAVFYRDRSKWERAQREGRDLLKEHFDMKSFFSQFGQRLSELKNCLQFHRRQNFTGAILRHQSHYASQYMSKWIELKNRS